MGAYTKKNLLGELNRTIKYPLLYRKDCYIIIILAKQRKEQTMRRRPPTEEQMARREANAKKLEGRKFGEWTVKQYYQTHRGQDYYLCRCSCGYEKMVKGRNLLDYKSRSCGFPTRHRPGQPPTPYMTPERAKKEAALISAHQRWYLNWRGGPINGKR